MTSLKPTLEETLEKNNKRLQELEERTANWHKKRIGFMRKMAIASAVLLPVSARFIAAGGSMSWMAYGLFAMMGALLGWLIAKYTIGMFRGMFLYFGGSFIVGFFCFVCGWWTFTNISAFAVIFIVFGSFSWFVFGLILGLMSDSYDNDTVQV